MQIVSKAFIFFLSVFGVFQDTLYANNTTKFENYLDANASQEVLNLYAGLNTKQKNKSLEKSNPLRNSFGTFAAQNAFLLIKDALSQSFFQRQVLSHNNSCQTKLHRSFNISPLGEYVHIKTQKQTPAFSLGIGGITTQLTYEYSDKVTFGSYLSYVYSNITENKNFGKASVNQGFLGFYSQMICYNLSLDTSLSGGFYHLNNKRNISLVTYNKQAGSNTNGWQIAPQIQLSYLTFNSRSDKANAVGFSPFIAGSFIACWQNGYTEHGADVLDMQVKDHFCSLFQGEAGIKFIEPFSNAWGTVFFNEKISYIYENAFRTGRSQARLAGTSQYLTQSTLSTPFNIGAIQIGAEIQPYCKSTNYNITYQGEFSSQYQSHEAIFEIKTIF